jgi:hypothetical protein
MKHLIAYLILIITGCGCCSGEITNGEELTLPKKAYYGEELRRDGYYYHVSSIDGRIISIVFFYNNGVVFFINGDGSKIQDLAYWDSHALSNEWIELMKKEKICWGLYLIENESIVIQRWGGSTSGVHPVITSYGTIINDTTYKIIKTTDSGRSDADWTRDIIYNFRTFSPKPDSTNVFIP